MAFGGPRSSCVRPGAHSARHQDFRNNWMPCRMAWPFVFAGAHAPHSDETPDPTPTRGSSHSARRLRSLAFLCSSDDKLKRLRERVAEQTALIAHIYASASGSWKRTWPRIATTPAGRHPRTHRSRSHHHARNANPAGASPVDNRADAVSLAPWSITPTSAGSSR